MELEHQRTQRDYSINDWPTVNSLTPYPESTSGATASRNARDELDPRDQGEATWIDNILDLVNTFVKHTDNLVSSERINFLLVFVPVGIIVGLLNLDPILDFVLNALAIIPLAVVISTATESIASRLGDTLGALLNVTVGNAAELMIFFVALAKNQIRIVQASLLGSILANLLLVLGTAFIAGGLRYEDKLQDRPAARTGVGLLDFGILVSLFPAAFLIATNRADPAAVKPAVLTLSRLTAAGLIIVYILYLIFQTAIRPRFGGSDEELAAMELSNSIPLVSLHRISSRTLARDSSDVYPPGNGREPRRPNLEKLRSGMSRSRWFKWITASGLASFPAPRPNVSHAQRPTIPPTRRPANQDKPKSHQQADNGHEIDENRSQNAEAGPDSHYDVSDRLSAHVPPQATASASRDRRTIHDDDTSSTQSDENATASTLPPAQPPSTRSSTTTPSDDGSIASLDFLMSEEESRNFQPPINPQGSRRPGRHKRTSTMHELREHRREEIQQSRTPLTVAITLLVVAASFAAVSTELAVDAIPSIVESWRVSQIFIGFIVLPVVGNAAEHVIAFKLALRNKLVLAKSVALESSTQIILLITPAMVLIGWARGSDMSLQFEIYEIASIVITSLVASLLVRSGEGHWKHGALLWTTFLIIALGAVIYPTTTRLHGRSLNVE